MKSELTSSSGVRLIPVTPGSFIMGSPRSEVGHEFWEGEREVTLSHEFYLGATPVTQRQYERVTGENPTDHPGSAEDAPVDSVRWQAATEFCGKLTEIDRGAGILSDDWEYRLPTETEWEYACRAGTETRWSFGNDDKPAAQFARFGGKNDIGPLPAGQLKPNRFGLRDMHGNLWEWCQDWYGEDYFGSFGKDDAVNPTGPVAGTERVLRGGSWGFPTIACRSTHREHNRSSAKLPANGFRVVLSVEAVKQALTNRPPKRSTASGRARGCCPRSRPRSKRPKAATRLRFTSTSR